MNIELTAFVTDTKFNIRICDIDTAIPGLNRDHKNLCTFVFFTNGMTFAVNESVGWILDVKKKHNQKPYIEVDCNINKECNYE